MAIKFHILNTSGKLNKYKNKILDKAKESLSEIKNFIPIDNVDVVICSKKVFPQIGVGGYAPDANTIFLYIDTEYQHLDSSIETQVLRILAHESHHCLRWRSPGYGKTLYEAMITEGLADHFELEVTGKMPQPWSLALKDDKLQEMEEKAKPSYWAEYDHSLWFYGTNVNEVPNWTGYSLGFKFVNEYIKITNEKPSNLYNKPAKEIYDTLSVHEQA